MIVAPDFPARSIKQVQHMRLTRQCVGAVRRGIGLNIRSRRLGYGTGQNGLHPPLSIFDQGFMHKKPVLHIGFVTEDLPMGRRAHAGLPDGAILRAQAVPCRVSIIVGSVFASA